MKKHIFLFLMVLMPGLIKSQVIETILVYDTIFVYDTIYQVYDASLNYDKIIPLEAELDQVTHFFKLKTATISKNGINNSEIAENESSTKKIGNTMTENLKLGKRTFRRNRKKRKPSEEINHTGSLNPTEPGKKKRKFHVFKFFAAATLSAATATHPAPATAQKQDRIDVKTEEIAIIKKFPAQISFIYPLGTSGKSSKNTAYNMSLNMFQGVTGDIYGAEVGGLTNINKGSVRGAQIAGINNLTRGTVSGTQIAGITNIAGNNVKGIQIAGITNIAGENVKGIQIAGILNHTKGNLKGVQIGLINNAGNSKGFQLGLINFIDSIDNGFSFGLLNFPRLGFYDELELTFADYANTAISYKLGYKKFYTILTAGTNYIYDNLFLFGMGFGHIKEISEKFWLQPEIISYNYFPYDFENTQFNSSNHLKLGLRYNFSKRTAISFAPGIYANVLDNRDGEAYSISFLNPVSVIEGDTNNVELGVGFSIGLILY